MKRSCLESSKALACIAHKSSEICERCRLRQQNPPATPDNSTASGRFLGAKPTAPALDELPEQLFVRFAEISMNSSAKRSLRSLSGGTRDLRPGCSSYQLATFVDPTGSYG